MQLADVWEKIANNARLTPEELAFLKRSATETQLRNSFVAGNTTPENTLALNLPINVIYSQALHANTASLTIEIPPNYNHLMVFCAVRTDNAAYYDFLHGQFNGDTNTNYAETYAGTINGVASHGQQLSRDDFGVSITTAANATANAMGSAMLFIPHYNDSNWKTVIKLEGTTEFTDATQMLIFNTFATWKSTSKITSFKIFPETGSNILAGSIITILGIK